MKNNTKLVITSVFDDTGKTLQELMEEVVKNKIKKIA